MFSIKDSKAWPVTEAQRIIKRLQPINKSGGANNIVLQTGYGPSGLPHIGTFGEVARTSMIKFALEQIIHEDNLDFKVKLIVFSDDLDGLRKVPENIENKSVLEDNIGKPLTKVPDPYGTHQSFGEHNNSMLCKFLNKFGFDYKLYSATELYESGFFNDMLIKVLNHHEEIINIVAPTLGEERKVNYSPFLPIDKKTGKVLEAKIISINTKTSSLVYIDSNGLEVETSILNGHTKLQWKVDWAMRWCALDVDYEMYGKDLIPSFELSYKICKVLNGHPPVNLNYEMFLDEKGQKISKSKGNGLSIEEWLNYANQESLSLYMYTKPKTAKRLYFGVIPKCVDEWMQHLVAYNTKLSEQEQFNSPIKYIYNDNIPNMTNYISFSLIINLVSVIQPEDESQIWYFVDQYKKLSDTNREIIGSLFKYSINYYKFFIQPNLHYKIPNEHEKKLLSNLKCAIEGSKINTEVDELQTLVYNIGVEGELKLKDWFSLLYQCLLGRNDGPRMGSFIKLVGKDKFLLLLDQSIKRSF